MLKELLPISIAKDEKVQALAEALEEQFEKLCAFTETPCILPRIDELPEPVLDLLACQFHVEGWELASSIEKKRNLIKSAIELHKYKGTPYAIKHVFQLLDIDAELQEWFEYGGEPYTFAVKLANIVDENTPISRLIELINQYKNVRSHIGRFDFTCIMELLLNSTSCSLADLSPEIPFELQVEDKKILFVGSSFTVRAETQKLLEVSTKEGIRASGLTDIEFAFKPEIPAIEIETEAIPRVYTATIELSTDGSDTIFKDYFSENQFIMPAQTEVSQNTNALISLEV